MNKTFKLLTALILSVLFLLGLSTGCGKKNPSAQREFSKLELVDGVYTGEYSDQDDEHPSTYKVEITIENGKITACTGAEYDENGNEKGDEYAAINDAAAKAVAGIRQYPELLVAAQDPEKIDAISGATLSYNRFKEAVWQALDKAVKK